MTKLLAVYGTLKRGYGNHQALIRDWDYVGTTRIKGFNMYQMGFPMIFHGDREITIEVYKIPDVPGALRRVDQLEGYNENSQNNNFYLREEVETEFGTAFIYVGARSERESNLPLIENGIWGYKSFDQE
jgi:gamma-glutamylcyclotransferase (GGCT)/AIG2-like uncharacterized protein YtfP